MSFSAFDHRCMAEAITLARRGLFTTMPNPRVGCVLARNGEILGRGWHERAGEAHAELRAINDARGRAGNKAGDAVRGASAYVTLEPCSHQGRTGPCTQALVQAGVAEVIVAMKDPNPTVDGAGIAALEAAGIVCRSGLMEAAARALNPGFLSRMERGRPWVRVKLAQSLDGRTALANGKSQWITGKAARHDVQRWRARADAILTGIGTVLADDPSLNLRLEGLDRQPLRVIADSRWRTPMDARILNLEGSVLVAGRDDMPLPETLHEVAECLPLPAELHVVRQTGHGHVSLVALLEALAAREVNQVHVEAGATLCGALLREQLVDELLLYQAPTLLGEAGRPSIVLGTLENMQDRPLLTLLERVSVGEDLRMRFRPQYCED